MTKFNFEASKDGVDIDYETVVTLPENDCDDASENNWFDLQQLAEKHGCNDYSLIKL